MAEPKRGDHAQGGRLRQPAPRPATRGRRLRHSLALLAHELGARPAEVGAHWLGAGDRLGRLAVTKDGLAERDRVVRDSLRAAGVPACVTLAGGYSDLIDHTVEINRRTIEVFVTA